MKLDFAVTLQDAWALFRRDRDLLLRLAGPFVFVPAFALALLVPEPPLPDAAAGDNEAQALAWAQTLTTWAGANAGWYLLAYLIGHFGTATLYALYLDPDRPDVGGALRRAGQLLARYMLAMLIVAVPAGAGLLLWVLPGLYVLGRTMLTGPLLLAERPIGAAAAVLRSLALTRGSGLALMGLAAFTYLSGWLLGQPFMLVDGWMRTAGAANPVALALVDAGAALAATAAGMAQGLIGVAAYRRLAR